MSQVNPPYLIKKIRPRDQLTKEMNNYLDQLERFNEQMYRRTGGTTDAVASEQDISDLSARLAQVEYEITDDPFTVDSTGWTVDTSYVTADWAKA
jgi:hypothetical protein